jgi:polyhydroxyalkanoate synthase
MIKRAYIRAVIVLLIVYVIFDPVYAQEETKSKIIIKEHVTNAADGWDISLRRYSLEDTEKKDVKAAVVLCHGFNFNNLFWDLDEKVSLARYLTVNGYDVWTPSLRGSGLSSKPLLSTLKDINRINPATLAQGLVKAPSDITKVNWTIDDHINKDVPAILKYVKEKSGFDKVYWIGHSMGGIIIFGHLELKGQDDVAGFMAIGPMTVMPQPLSPQLKRIGDQEEIATASLIFNTKAAGDLRAFTFGAVKYPIEEMLLKRENVHQKALFRLFRKCIEDTSPGVVKQFSRSIREGRMVTSLSSATEYDYTANIKRITVPALIMAGSHDAFVTKGSLKECYKRLSSRDKGLVIFSKKNGYSAEYGHSDVIIGKNSKEEVYPVILRWLDKRTTGSSTMDIAEKAFLGVSRPISMLWKLLRVLLEKIR